MTEIFSELEKITTWSNAGLTFVACIAFGYAWKLCKWKWFPNEAIPIFVMLCGAWTFCGLSGTKPTADVSNFAWLFRSGVVGFVIGFIAVIVHGFILKKVEDYLRAKFGFVEKILNGNGKAPEPKPGENK